MQPTVHAATSTAEDVSEVHDQCDISPSVVVEQKSPAPLVFNAIVRHEKPKYIKMDYIVALEVDYQ